MPMMRDEIYTKVQQTLVEALGVDEGDVTPQATLTGDLGAESIDFLDIVFRLEKTFAIKIPRGELFPDNILNNPEYVADGKLTEAGLAMLKQRMPHADFSEFEQSRDVARLAELFKVDTIVNYVAAKLNSAA